MMERKGDLWETVFVGVQGFFEAKERKENITGNRLINIDIQGQFSF